MSSLTRRIQRRILAKAGKFTRASFGKPKGTPYRHCKLYYDAKGNITHWTRYR